MKTVLEILHSRPLVRSEIPSALVRVMQLRATLEAKKATKKEKSKAKTELERLIAYPQIKNALEGVQRAMEESRKRT